MTQHVAVCPNSPTQDRGGGNTRQLDEEVTSYEDTKTPTNETISILETKVNIRRKLIIISHSWNIISLSLNLLFVAWPSR